MAEKDFGVKRINLIGASGTPTITSPNNLNINAVTVAISTDISIGGQVSSNLKIGDAYSVGIGTTNPTSKLWVGGNGYFSGVVTATKFVGQLDATSAQAQSVGFATTSTSVIGGIASVTQLSVSGISTVGVLTATSIGIGTTNPTSKLWVNGDGFFTGTVTATKFSGQLDATSAQAQSVGFATTSTNLAGGALGSIPYQSSSGITTFLDGATVNNKVLLYNLVTNKPYWGDASSAEGSFGGITVIDESTNTFSDIVTLNILGNNISATSGGTGIASIRVNDNLVGTSLSISGVGTFGTGLDVLNSLSITSLEPGDNLFEIYNAAQNVVVAVTTTGNLGIGTSNAQQNLWVEGNGYFSGVVTATKFSGKIDETSASTLNVAFASTAGIATYTSEWILGANGSSDYTFTGPGFIGAVNDPTLYLSRGQQYKFTNTMGMHPFRIQSTENGSAGTQYNDGIVGNDVSNGTLTWNVQFNAPNLLYYQCTAHGGMGGKIYIIDAGIGTDVSINTIGIITANSFRGDGSQLTGLTAGVSISTNTTNQSQYLTYVTGTGTTAGFGITTTGLVFNPSSGNLGIGTTNPTSKLWVSGDGYFIGSVTSDQGFYVNGELIGNSILGTNIVGTSLSISGISNLGETRIRNTSKLKFGGTGATSNFYIQYNSATNSLDFVAE